MPAASPAVPAAEHPFAPFVRILGKGKRGTRSLTQSEAHSAFAMILRNEVEPLQLGAFLMLLRVKEESAAEVAGFVEACRTQMSAARPLGKADLDWSSCAGKKHQHPWYLLAILLLNQAGYRVFLHGAEGHTAGRLYTEQAMRQLGLPVAANWQEVETQLADSGLSYLSLRHICPGLHEIMQLKPLLGLRSPVNSFARLLNPLAAAASIQSIFHPAYGDLHRAADALLAQPASLVFKGDSGEAEIRPQADSRLLFQRAGTLDEAVFTRRLPGRPVAVEQPAVAPLRDLWRGAPEHGYGRLATLATCASALMLLRDDLDQTTAWAEAERLWRERDRERLAPCR